MNIRQANLNDLETLVQLRLALLRAAGKGNRGEADLPPRHRGWQAPLQEIWFCLHNSRNGVALVSY